MITTLSSTGGLVRHQARTHRYVFKLYALDTELGLGESVEKEALEMAMQVHILETTELSVLYSRR